MANRSRRRKGTLIVLVVALASATAGSGGSAAAMGNKATSHSLATVIVEKLPGYGQVLATSSGRALFMLTSDPPSGSRCSGSCTQEWQPFFESGAPTAGPGVNQSLLSTFARSDGRKQVAYAKHALYTHAGSDVAAATGSLGEGGIWYLISPSGKPILQTTSGAY
jgi:predicted lipoprotein with Yx(FWY)xxD motif